MRWLAVSCLALLSCRSAVGPRGPGDTSASLVVTWANPAPGTALACGDDLSSRRQHWVKGQGSGPWTLPSVIPAGGGTVDCYAGASDGPLWRWEIFTHGYDCGSGGSLRAEIRLERTAGQVMYQAVFTGEGCSVAPASGAPGPRPLTRADRPPPICCGEKVRGED